MFKKFILLTIILSAFLFLLMPVVASAGIVSCGRGCLEYACLKYDDNGKCTEYGKECITPAEGVPLNEAQPCTLCDIFKMIQILVNGFSVALLVWASLYITLGGIAILSSGGAPDNVSKGKKMITYAIIGLVIAFGAWIIINETMLLLVGKVEEGGTNAFPWPWDRIECAPTQGGGGGGGEAKCGAWCCCDSISGENHCNPKKYSSSSDCNLTCQNYCTAYAGNELSKYCCLETKGKCPGTTCGGEGPVAPLGEYCACEVPVYDLDPNTYPSQASIIGTNIKVTKLANLSACMDGCVSGNSATYCPSTLKQDKVKLYCADESAVKSKRVYAVKVDRTTDCMIGGCWSDPLECAATLQPEATQYFNSSYAKRCFVNGQALCNQMVWIANTTTYCKKAVGPCSSDKPYKVYRFAQEKAYGSEMDALACSTYSNGEYSCRLNYKYDTCSGGGNGGTTPPADWRFQSGIQYQTEQKADATTALTNFLNCFYEKAPSNIGYISAITDKDIYNGTCDPKICKTSSCTTADCGEGKACDHECHSCHYGGTCTSTKSYAVDFGDEENVCAIATAANKCSGVNKIYGPQTCGGKVTDDNQHEDHVHISVTSSCCGN